jgi:membrane carboxypeptidase/penicillin-binding protein PbpC
MTDMLKEVVASGTGTNAKIKGQTVAGKTGTNSDYKGVSFAGMTGWYSGAIWVGHDNYKALYSKATGGNSVAPLWKAIMERIHTMKSLQDRDIIDKDPEAIGLQKITTCGVSGLVATRACSNDVNSYGTISDYWAVDNMPPGNCNMHQELTLCGDSGMLATQFCPNTRNRSAVIIPIGHQLYDFIDEYRSTMTKYLGEFAGLKLTQDASYNQMLIDKLTCQRHSQTWEQDVQYWHGNVDEAQRLLAYAYDMMTNRGSELTMEEYVSVTYCMRRVEGILDSYGTDELQSAVSELRYALTVFN